MPAKIKAVIIEDELAAKTLLIELLETYFSKNIEIIASATSVKNGIKIIKKHKPQLVFLDIQLDDGEGFEILDNVDNTNFEVIFTTGLRNQKEKALDYFAFYYLNKPLDSVKFRSTITTFLNKQSSFNFQQYVTFKKQLESNHQSISIPVKGGVKLVPVQDIIYCKAEGSYTFIQTVHENYLTAKNLKKFENLLENNSFFRVHRSALVNLKHITGFDKSGIINLSNKETVEVSARNKKNFLNILKLMS